MNLPDQNLLDYQNKLVISRYRRVYPNTTMSPEAIFTELMKYFWLCHKHAAEKAIFPNDDALKFECSMHVEMEEIDNMWHTFLLFTRDYLAFCNTFFNGEFIHHDPLPKSVEISKEAYETELHRYLTYIYDSLGEETLVKWFGRFN
jgi:hypothetical protein